MTTTVAEAYRVQPEGEEEGAPMAAAAAAAEAEEATVVKRAVSRHSVRLFLFLLCHCLTDGQAMFKGRRVSMDNDTVGFILDQAQAILFAYEYSIVGTSAKSAIRRGIFATRKGVGEGEPFGGALTPRERDKIIDGQFAQEYDKFRQAFNKETTAKRYQLLRAYRQFGPLVVLDRRWAAKGPKTPEFWKLAAALAARVAEEDGEDDVAEVGVSGGWELSSRDGPAAAAVVEIVRALGGDVAVGVVSELLDHPRLTRVYDGRWES
jgi:hypothetical protein